MTQYDNTKRSCRRCGADISHLKVQPGDLDLCPTCRNSMKIIREERRAAEANRIQQALNLNNKKPKRK